MIAHRPTKLISCFTRPSICTYGVAICFCGVTVPINRNGFAVRFYAFGVAIRFHRHGPSSSR